MKVRLVRAAEKDAEKLWKMQADAFWNLYQKYGDTDTNPAAEKKEKTLMRLKDPCSYYYFIQGEERIVGAIRVVDPEEAGKRKRISPIFILPEYRRKGYAQAAIRLAEEIHGRSGWELDTILQEEGNCRLYEQLGYCRTGETEKINEKMTLVRYRKEISQTDPDRRHSSRESGKSGY